MQHFERYLLAVAAAATLMGPLFAQSAERQATFKGGGGNGAGKCTVEVYVDGVADVEIRGDRGFLRTLSGQPAQWRRFECSGPLPANPSELRFVGVDGRGKQDLVQTPSNGRAAAVVRIQDSAGGAEGYTFDLVWRGGDYGSLPVTGQWQGGMDRGFTPGGAVRACENAVREAANRQYGLQAVDFRNLNVEDNRGRNDVIVGAFDAPRGNYRETYRFSCAMDLANGAVRGVDITQGQETAMAGRDDGTYACQRAAEQRIQGSGYRNVQFGLPEYDNLRRDTLAGTARAQRGNNGRSYDFNYRCSVNLNNGDVRSVQVTRR